MAMLAIWGAIVPLWRHCNVLIFFSELGFNDKYDGILPWMLMVCGRNETNKQSEAGHQIIT